nr:iron ABC transporter permease [Sphaerochaetaceae bacterium]
MSTTNNKSILIKRDPSLFCALVIIWSCLIVFIFFPLARLLTAAFFKNGKFSMELIRKNFLNPFTFKVLWNSLYLAVFVSVFGTFLGYLFALLVNRTKLPTPLKLLINAVTLLPLISPPFTSSISLTMALGPNGTILKLLHIENFS